MKRQRKDSSPAREDKMPLKPGQDEPRRNPATEAEKILDREQAQSGDEKHNRDRV